jgi:hypothetical protein
MTWLPWFLRRWWRPSSRAPIRPISVEDLTAWEAVAQTVYDNSLQRPDARWTRLRFQALKALDDLAEAKHAAQRRSPTQRRRAKGV